MSLNKENEVKPIYLSMRVYQLVCNFLTLKVIEENSFCKDNSPRDLLCKRVQELRQLTKKAGLISFDPAHCQSHGIYQPAAVLSRILVKSRLKHQNSIRSPKLNSNLFSQTTEEKKI